MGKRLRAKSWWEKRMVRVVWVEQVWHTAWVEYPTNLPHELPRHELLLVALLLINPPLHPRVGLLISYLRDYSKLLLDPHGFLLELTHCRVHDSSQSTTSKPTR